MALAESAERDARLAALRRDLEAIMEEDYGAPPGKAASIMRTNVWWALRLHDGHKGLISTAIAAFFAGVGALGVLIFGSSRQ
jgi:hypothetical protein